jgi:para-aminobenzoate synthetase component 1
LRLSSLVLREMPNVIELDWKATPLDVLSAWPADRALMMLHSGRVQARWARWSILATPAARYQFDGRSRWSGDPPPPLRHAARFTHDPLADLEAIIRATPPDHQSTGPFSGGWIGCFSYDLGRWIEPRAQRINGAVDDRHWPLIELAWCPQALLYDHIALQWKWIARSHDPQPDLIAAIESNLGRAEQFDADFSLGEFRGQMSRRRYESAVRRTSEYIAAGDIFQANIAQRFSADFEGSPRALARAAFTSAQPWYGSYLELDRHRAVISLSPELFLAVDPVTRHIITRPIKGTRPIDDDPRTLAESLKDAAELHMIVDLMRNDLGRVCEFGSIRVPSARDIETHPTVHHGVGEVAGTLREDFSVADLLRATFPGGSVTGAPKIRAMQIIDELEPVRRGPYCGAIGCISDDGAVHLSIAIRTMLLNAGGTSDTGHARGTVDYSAGAGIVADSRPTAEFEETLHKTQVLRALTDSWKQIARV